MGNKKELSLHAPCIRDGTGATEGNLGRSRRVHSTQLNPAREKFVSSEVSRTYWISLQDYNSLFPFNISSKIFSC